MPRKTYTPKQNSGAKLTAATIAAETVDALEKGWYHDSNKKNITIKDVVQQSMDNTVLYTPKDFKNPNFIKTAITTSKEAYPDIQELTVDVTNQTTLEAAQELVNLGKFNNVCLLNFASAKNPGGGFLNGARAQEESIARASGLYYCLTTTQVSKYYENNHRDKICLYTDHIIYSPNVPIFRSEHGDWLEPYYRASIISAPAPNAGVAKKRLEKQNADDKIYSVLENRIKYILTVAANHKCDALVLGAFGCGVFRNKPTDVAKIFHTLLNNQFANCFSMVRFAIPSNGPSENTTAFERVFS